jgi:acyl carrier protein
MTSGSHAMSPASLQGRAEVFSQVQQIVAERAGCPAERIRESDRLEQDLGLDSLDQVEIVMEVEEEFELNVPDEIANHVRTVGHIVDGVVTLLQSPAVS